MRLKRVTVPALILVAVVAAGCRSRVKPAATPAVAPPQTEAQIVEPPATDFASPATQPARDELAGSELNRVARDRGWIHDAFFAYDSNALDTEAREALDTSAQWLRQNPRVSLVIEGHCDERGTEQYNLALGERRAATAREYLAALGVDPDRVKHMSYGEERPFADGSDEQAWRLNRRAHLRVQ